MTLAGGLHLIASGTFTGNNAATTVALPANTTPDLFEIYNISDFASAAANTATQHARWVRGLSDGAGYVGSKTSGAATIAITSMQSSGCFTLQDTSNQTPGAVNTTGTAVSSANPGVVSATSTSGLSNTDVVRMIDVTGMQQISGMEFTIGSVVTNTSFELSYLDTSGFAAPGTTCSFRRVPFDPIYFPRRRFITNITQAASAVVTLSVTHGYSVGETVRFKVNSDNGMTEINDLIGEITAVSTANNTITVNIDSSGFTAFSFPTSATAAAGYTPAQVVPLGDAGNVLTGATDNQATLQMLIDTTVLDAASSGDTFRYFAYKFVDLD